MFFPKVGTGFNLIDNLWQGFFKRRTYLVTGPVDSGKTVFGLQFAARGLSSKEKVVYFTDERPEDILLRAEGLQFDLLTGLENNDFLIFNFGFQNKIDEISDQLLSKTINEIIQIIEKEQPSRLIFDRFSFLLKFKDFEALKQNIRQLIYAIEKFKVTTLIIVGEPASDQAEKILNFLNSLVTATIKLSGADSSEKRKINLKARLGHYPVSYSGSFLIQPGIGLTQPEPKKRVIEIPPEKTIEPEPDIPSEPIVTEPAPVKTEIPQTEKIPEPQPAEEPDLIEPIESIPEYPVRDLDRDDFTGLFNFDGMLNLFARAIEKRTSFSLMIVTMVKGVESRAKRLLLSHDLATAVKNSLGKPFPVGRYSDKILVYLHRIAKPEAEQIANTVGKEALEKMISDNETLKGVELKTGVHAYPDDFQSINEVESIVQTGGEE